MWYTESSCHVGQWISMSPMACSNHAEAFVWCLFDLWLLHIKK